MVTSLETATGGKALPSAHATAVTQKNPSNNASTVRARRTALHERVRFIGDVDFMKRVGWRVQTRARDRTWTKPFPIAHPENTPVGSPKPQH